MADDPNPTPPENDPEGASPSGDNRPKPGGNPPPPPPPGE